MGTLVEAIDAEDIGCISGMLVQDRFFLHLYAVNTDGVLNDFEITESGLSYVWMHDYGSTFYLTKLSRDGMKSALEER